MKTQKNIASVLPIYAIILIVSLFITSTQVLAGGYPWNDEHRKPYDFTFGNNIDTHQQARIKANGELFGFLYVTPVAGNEVIDGIPVKKHCDGNTPDNECEVGWIIRGSFIGEPNEPTFVYKVNKDHPTWVMRSRSDIPQPASNIHFHWLGLPNGGGGFNQGDTREGYILELEAIDTFYFRHNDEDLLVRPGTDVSTHVNVVGSFPGFPKP